MSVIVESTFDANPTISTRKKMKIDIIAPTIMTSIVSAI